MNDFDSWATTNNLGHYLNVPKVAYEQQNIWKMPWINDLLDVIKHNGNVEDFISQQNKKLHDEYLEERQAPLKTKKAEFEAKLSQIKNSLAQSKSIQNNLSEFESDIQKLLTTFPNEQKNIKFMLSDYFSYGKFNQEFSTKRVEQKPKNFFDKLLNKKKIEKNNEILNNFIKKYEDKDLKSALNAFSAEENDSPLASNLKSRFEAICDLDHEKSDITREEAQNNDAKLENEQTSLQEKLQDTSARLDEYESHFLESNLIQKQAAFVQDFAKEQQNEILNPKQFSVENYVQCLENMNDDEPVLFNLGLSGSANEQAIENILKHNGLESGSEAHQWYIRQENLDISDNGKFEIFTPIMSAKEAKEIMPKLVNDFEDAEFMSSLIIPIKAKDWFHDPEYNKDSLTQEQINQGLEKLIISAKIQEDKKNGAIKPYDQILQKLGANSFDELPQAYSMDELKEKFPKDQYLFSGATASDDYTLLSARVGRNGIVYATPHIDYAAKYDGVTDVGSVTGGTATGDKYVSAIMGQALGRDVKVGFINVYEQSPNDKFFGYFGMEDYMKCRRTVDTPRTYNVCEFQNGVMQPTTKTAQTAVNRTLTKDQAVNGYIGKSAEFSFNNQTYLPLSYDSETFVTSDKNPIKAKIMHLSCKDNMNIVRDYYIPVPEKTDEFMQYILNNRQADMRDTFKHNCRQDVLARMEQQKSEFNQGVRHQMRANDFVQQRQETLQNAMSNTHNQSQKNEENISHQQSNNENIPIGKLILQKQGIIATPSHNPVHKTNNQQNSINLIQEFSGNIRE